MAEVVNSISSGLSLAYSQFLSWLPNWAQNFVNLFLLVLVIVIYSIFIWKFYRFIAKKNIFELNLNQYNRSEHPVISKFFAGLLYFLEYIVIMPFLIFFWFGIFTLFLVLMTEDIQISALLIISATIISAIRMTAYYKEDLSKDLAKLLPFTLLGLTVTKPGFFNFDRILIHIQQIPTFLNDIIIYLGFIIVLEIILRTFQIIFSLFGIEDEEETIEQAEKSAKSNQ